MVTFRFRFAAWAGLLAAGSALAQSPAPPAATTPPPSYLLPVLDRSQMDADDSALLHGLHKQIDMAAAFHGYDLSRPGWTAREVECPYMPDYLLLHYSKHSRAGKEWLFTALVPRAGGPITVIPLLYRDAAVSRSVPSATLIAVEGKHLKKEPPTSDAGWLRLGACYAAVFGAEPVSASYGQTASVPTPVPVLRVEGDLRTVRLPGLLLPDGVFRIWDVSFDARKHVKSITWSDEVSPRPVSIPASQIPGGIPPIHPSRSPAKVPQARSSVK